MLEGILINTPEQTIKFKVYIRDEDDGVEVDRRLMRIRNQNKLPISVWAHWLVESILIRGHPPCYIPYRKVLNALINAHTYLAGIELVIIPLGTKFSVFALYTY